MENKKMTLEEILEQMEQNSFFGSHIPKKKQQEEPEVIFSIQENFSDKPWEVKTMKGECGVFIVHKGNGEVQSGVTGAISNPLDFLILCEALKDMQKRVMKMGIDYLGEKLGE